MRGKLELELYPDACLPCLCRFMDWQRTAVLPLQEMFGQVTLAPFFMQCVACRDKFVVERSLACMLHVAVSASFHAGIFCETSRLCYAE